jgi:hypothetical protein
VSLLEQAAGALGQAAGQVPIETVQSASQQLNGSIQMITSVGGPTGERLVGEALAISADLEAIANRMAGLRSDLQETATRIMQGYA